MNFLPVAERELRVAARKKGTFRLRVLAALITLLIASVMLFVFSTGGAGPSPNQGKYLFAVLSAMAFIYSFAAGIFLTSDCLSEEKREGTLGLLFLTSLRGYDVVFGKLAATSLHAVYALVAALPILALGLMLGGLLAEEFWKAILAVLNMLFVSLAVGMLASTFARESLPAMNIALLFLTILIGLSYLVDWSWAGWNPRAFVHRSSLSSPLYAYLSALGWARGQFWQGVLVSHAVGWACLALAAWRAPRNVHEHQTKRRKARTRRHAARARNEAALRGADPLGWLVSRSRHFRLWLLLLVLAAVALTSVSIGSFSTLIAIAQGTASILQFLLYLWMAAHAARFFVDGIRSGALELILCTPVTPRAIVRAQWRLYLRTFWLPVFFLIGTEQLVHSQQWIHYTSNRMTAYLIAHQANSVIVFLSTVVAIGWFGMWMGLRNRKPHIAILKTFAFVFIIPGVGFIVLQILFGVYFMNSTSVFRQLVQPVTTCLLWVAKDVAFVLWSRRQLARNFHAAVAGMDLLRARPARLRRG